MLKRILPITLACTLVLSSATFAFADGKAKGKLNFGKIKTKQENILTEAEEYELNHKGWKELRDKLEQKKDEIEASKDEIEGQKDELEQQYEEAKNGGNYELAQELEQQLQQLKIQMESLKQNMRAIKMKRRAVIRNKYSEEELQKLEEAKEELLKLGEDIKVLEADSILSRKADMKFDTPPVIKGNRTLIPVRAIVEGFGAQVAWNPETREVTVIKGDIEILLPLDSKEVYVNGEQVELDTKSEIMNSRTYVPLRFIVETFGLKVDWDAETETIELDDEEVNIEEEVVEESIEEGNESEVNEEEAINEEEITSAENNEQVEEDTIETMNDENTDNSDVEDTVDSIVEEISQEDNNTIDEAVQ